MLYPAELWLQKNGEGGIRTLGTRSGYNSLAGSPIQPLSHLSIYIHVLTGSFGLLNQQNQHGKPIHMAGGYGEGGIRTHGTLRLNGFQDRLLRPLGHLS